MTTPEARRAALQEALQTGRIVRDRLTEAVADVRDQGLAAASRLASLSKDERRITDSLALTFATLVGIVQDQLIRVVLLLAEEEDATRLTRRDQRRRAEAIGLVDDPALRLDRVAEARNRIAHQYPRDPDRQERLLRDILEQSGAAIAAFDGIDAYVARVFFGDRQAL